jgi:hypothetical protein
VVRAECPDNIVERCTFADDGAFPDVFRRGNLLAHEIVHTLPPVPPATAPAIYRRLASYEYQDWQNPTSATAEIPAESSARRLQRSWRTDYIYNSFGDVVQVLGPAASATRIAEDGSLRGPSPLLPYTMEHRYQRPATIIDHNGEGLIKRLQEPDGIVTEYAYFSRAAFNSGTYSPDGGGLLAEERRDTTDTTDRRFWYLGQPVAVRRTLWQYDRYGHVRETTDSRGYRHIDDCNALGLPLRVETGIPPAPDRPSSRVPSTTCTGEPVARCSNSRGALRNRAVPNWCTR